MSDDEVDPEFEKQLLEFKHNLEATPHVSRKMIPNLSSEWVKKLREELKAKKTVPCMTTSTAGVSFNSPPATDRACFEGQIVEEYDVDRNLKIA